MVFSLVSVLTVGIVNLKSKVDVALAANPGIKAELVEVVVSQLLPVDEVASNLNKSEPAVSANVHAVPLPSVVAPVLMPIFSVTVPLLVITFCVPLPTVLLAVPTVSVPNATVEFETLTLIVFAVTVTLTAALVEHSATLVTSKPHNKKILLIKMESRFLSIFIKLILIIHLLYTFLQTTTKLLSRGTGCNSNC